MSILLDLPEEIILQILGCFSEEHVRMIAAIRATCRRLHNLADPFFSLKVPGKDPEPSVMDIYFHGTDKSWEWESYYSFRRWVIGVALNPRMAMYIKEFNPRALFLEGMERKTPLHSSDISDRTAALYRRVLSRTNLPEDLYFELHAELYQQTTAAYECLLLILCINLRCIALPLGLEDLGRLVKRVLEHGARPWYHFAVTGGDAALTPHFQSVMFGSLQVLSIGQSSTTDRSYLKDVLPLFALPKLRSLKVFGLGEGEPLQDARQVANNETCLNRNAFCLTLWNCTLTENGFRKIMSSFANLRTLDIFWSRMNNGPHNQSIGSVIRKHGSSLRHLRVAGMKPPETGPSSLENTFGSFSNLKNLTRLEITKLGFQNDGRERPADVLPTSLEVLYLFDAGKIEDEPYIKSILDELWEMPRLVMLRTSAEEKWNDKRPPS